MRESLIQDIVKEKLPELCLVDPISVEMHLPFQIGGFSDFYCSLEHVQNVKVQSDAVSLTDFLSAPP